MPAKRTRRPLIGNARKPRPDFPLYPHATGRWAKKIRQKLHYFGSTADDPKGQAALERWLEQKDDLLAGRTPRVKADGLTIQELVNRYLTAKKARLDSGELAPHSFADLYANCRSVGNVFGWHRLVVDLAADDFQRLRQTFAKKWGPVRLGNEIQRCRSIFKYGYEAGLMQQPIRFGPDFKKPSKKTLRLERNKKGPRMLEAAELRQVLDAAGQPMRAMILLGVNCAFGPVDVATLPQKALDLKAGWVNFPRPKTGVERRVPLWPETITALQEAIADRPAPKDKANVGLAFITKFGLPWWRCNLQSGVSTGAGAPAKTIFVQDNVVVKEFIKLLKALKLHRPGLGFYALRHGFETIGGDSRDQIAVDHIMGHARDDMASVYRERISDERLVAVTEHVRQWLFGDTKQE